MKQPDMNAKDMTGALMALQAWFRSQEINPCDAAWLCINLAGFLAGKMASSEDSLEVGYGLLSEALARACTKSFDHDRRKKS